MYKIMNGVFYIFILTSVTISAQEHESHEAQHELLRHKILLQYGLVFIPEGHSEGHEDDTGQYIAAYGLGYSYRLNHKWGLWAEVNLEGGNYLIKGDIPRENALIIAAGAAYELLPRVGIFFGGGIEIEKHKNFSVIRVGAEYIFNLGQGWSLAPLLTFDHKIDYTSWEIAVAISKSF